MTGKPSYSLYQSNSPAKKFSHKYQKKAIEDIFDTEFDLHKNVGKF